MGRRHTEHAPPWGTPSSQLAHRAMPARAAPRAPASASRAQARKGGSRLSRRSRGSSAALAVRAEARLPSASSCQPSSRCPRKCLQVAATLTMGASGGPCRPRTYAAPSLAASSGSSPNVSTWRPQRGSLRAEEGRRGGVAGASVRGMDVPCEAQAAAGSLCAATPHPSAASRAPPAPCSAPSSQQVAAAGGAHREGVTCGARQAVYAHVPRIRAPAT